MLEVTDRAWLLELERVCRRRLVEPAFQPIVDLVRGVVCGYEGLSRIGVPELDAGPEEWFTAAAWHGFAARLEATALEAILAKRHQLPENCFLSVNASPDGLMSDEVGAVLAAQEDLSGLVLEITEQSPVEDYAALMERLDSLRERGATVAVDDTGAGYASIRHLLILRPEIVKLDRSLVEGIDKDASRAAAVAALGAFASVLDAWVVAEGIETKSELEKLMALEVPLVQGYYLGRPGTEMEPLSPPIAAEIQRRRADLSRESLACLAQQAPTVRAVPALVAEPTVLVDDNERPLQLFVPVDGRRARPHPAMCISLTEDITQVALRAAARRGEDRFAPLCACDEIGRLVGVVRMETIVEQLATRLQEK